MFGPEKFVVRVDDDALAPLAAAGDFAYVVPDEPTAHGCIVAVRADSPGNATRGRRIAVENDRSGLRAANLGFPDIAVTRANETMIRAVVVFVGRAVCDARPVTTGRRPEAAEGVSRGLSPSGESGSDGALSRPSAQSRQG